MASSPTIPIHLLPSPKILTNHTLFLPPLAPRVPLLKKQHPRSTLKCTPSPSHPIPENTQLETQKKSELLKKSRSLSELDRPEPPNFEIGWKRTKEIKQEKPKGYVIMDFLEKLEGLMARGEFGSTKLLAKVGEIVSAIAREEAEVLREGGEVEERMVTELGRVLRLMEMDLEMMKAAVKEETLNERLQQAKARCRQAILVANSF